MYLFDFQFADSIEVSSFRNVPSDEFVCIFDTSFLPSAERVREIHFHILLAFHPQPFGNQFVRGKLASVVGRDGSDDMPIKCLSTAYPPVIHPSPQPAPRASRAAVSASKGCWCSSHQGQDGMLPVVYYQIHLKVSESPSVRLRRTLVDARAVGGCSVPWSPAVSASVGGISTDAASISPTSPSRPHVYDYKWFADRYGCFLRRAHRLSDGVTSCLRQSSVPPATIG